MKQKRKSKVLLPETQLSGVDKPMILNKSRLLEVVDDISKKESINSLREAVFDFQREIKYFKSDTKGLFNISTNGDTIKLNQKYLFDELNQIIEARTLEQSRYYLLCLEKREHWSSRWLN